MHLDFDSLERAPEPVRRWALDAAREKLYEDARPPSTTRPEALGERSESPPTETDAVFAYLGTVCPRKSQIALADLAQHIVTEWHGDASIRAEFVGNIEVYAAFRHACAAGYAPGYHSTGEKRARLDPIARAILQGDEEDRACGVDPRLPVEARARQVWGLNPAVRQEFRDDVERYIASRRRAERSKRSR